MSTANVNPAERLSGTALEGGWQVGNMIPTGRRSGGTGGFFSVSYEVVSGERKAFLKAFDILTPINNAVAAGETFTTTLLAHLQAYEFETKLHSICADKNMKRIVKILSHGQVNLPPFPGEQISAVPYMIMELADGGDVRNYIGSSEYIDLSVKLYYLRDVASGLIQLHGAEIAHQDLKPSNVMIFGGATAKIGDLGRASKRDINSSNDLYKIAGDYAYAPPEQLYGYQLDNWYDRRQRCDLYQFASLISYLLFSASLNTMLKNRLPSQLVPIAWGGAHASYIDALPHLIKIFNEVLQEWEKELPTWLAPEIIDILQQCGTPSFSERGSRKTLSSQPSNLGLNRFVSQFDRLGFKATIEARKILKVTKP
ncbi:protein kinase domain-containing protein [Pseudomonas sp. H1_B04]